MVVVWIVLVVCVVCCFWVCLYGVWWLDSVEWWVVCWVVWFGMGFVWYVGFCVGEGGYDGLICGEYGRIDC